MLLILSDQLDAHADYLCTKIQQQNIPFFRFNLDTESLKYSTIHYENGIWSITQQKKVLDLNQVTSILPRRVAVELTLEEARDSDNTFKIWRNEWNRAIAGMLAHLRPRKWLNELIYVYRAENKYLQDQVARNIGFNVPPFIVSNQKVELLDFAKQHKECVLKMMAQEFYYEQNETKGFYVNKVSYEDLLEFQEEGENPIVLQRYIPKSFEVRYTVVGHQHFACKIDSQRSKRANIDWRRYDIPNTPHAAIEAPQDIQEKVTRLMQALNLNYGALDFIVTPEQDWYFLEINPMGQWLWIEALSGLNISDAMIQFLTQQ